jgi:hypothetical protein
MTIKASGRSALILATGLWVCFAGPSQAAAGADGAAAPVALNKSIKHSAHHWKKVAHRKSGKVALKSSAPKKAADVAEGDGDKSSTLPPRVANANAQLASADTPGGPAKAMFARANTILQATETQIVSADQLNDVDLALHESTAPAPALTVASADVPVAPVMASGDESSTWDKTSLIGKIFMAFGVMLTVASAARMFMA